MTNRRLYETLGKAVDMGLGHWLLDAYNRSVKKDVSMTVTTRVNTSNHYYLLEVYE